MGLGVGARGVAQIPLGIQRALGARAGGGDGLAVGGVKAMVELLSARYGKS
jgi:hypothetical protein